MLKKDNETNNLNVNKNNNFEPNQLGFRNNNEYVKITNYALFRRLGTVLLHFSRRSTIHGLNHLAQARSAKHRLFWLTISSCASLGFCINLFYLIEKFLQTPVLTNVFHDHNNFTYPDLSICIVNPIYFPPRNSTDYKHLVASIMEFYQLQNSSFVNDSHNFNIYSHKIELADYLFMHSQLNYSHSAWSTIVRCRYLQQDCNYQHFETRHIWPYGNCFTFNGTKMGPAGTRDVKKNSIFNGWRPDFKIVIYKALEYPEYLQIDPFNDINKPSGVLVMIHEPNTYPHIGESFVVDSFTQVDLKITTKSHLSSVKKCMLNRENYTYYDFKTNTSTEFVGRQSDCLFSIIQANIAKYCGCQLHKMPVLEKHKTLPFCFNKAFRNNNLSLCLHTSLNDVDREQLKYLCYRDLCKHPSYSTVVSHSKFPAVRERQTHMLWLEQLTYLEKLEIAHFKKSELFNLAILPSNETKTHNYTTIEDVYKNSEIDLLNEKFVNKNFMHLRFVPSSLFMDHVEETEEYPLSRLLSDIGGCVGLWVGASLITIFEFIDLLLDLSEILKYKSQATMAYKQNCKKKKENPTSNYNQNKVPINDNLIVNSYLNGLRPEEKDFESSKSIDPGGGKPSEYSCTAVLPSNGAEIETDLYFNINTAASHSSHSSPSMIYSDSSCSNSQNFLAHTDIIVSV